jgi:murein DD-endopeptidase MepM/ murein hydrolase activator NlpD
MLARVEAPRAFGRRGNVAARAYALRLAGLPRPRWRTLGVLGLLCSTVAWASLPRVANASTDEQVQWRALGVDPLESRGSTGLAMAPTDAAAPIAFAPVRAVEPVAPPPPVAAPASSGPLRISGRVEDGLYWSLRAAGASPEVAAAYLAALATQIDVGDVAPGSSFDMVLGSGHDLLYAGLTRIGGGPLQLVRWTQGGRPEWVDAANTARPEPVESGLMMPVAGGHITSYFGNRYHPILHYVRFHAGLDIGATWGSPIVAAGDGRIVAAGWAGGYGREVQIAHAGGITSLYGHMSDIVAAPGSYVRAGQLIGYVGSSGLSTGPHVHFEVRQNGTPVNPLSVHFASMPTTDPNLARAVKARLQALLRVGDRRG